MGLGLITLNIELQQDNRTVCCAHKIVNILSVGLRLKVLFVCLFTLYWLPPTLRLSLRFVLANHRQQCLEVSGKGCCVQKRLLAKSRTAVNQLASDWSWAHLNIGPALWLEVGPLWKTRGILQYKILPEGSPCIKQIQCGKVNTQNSNICIITAKE